MALLAQITDVPDDEDARASGRRTLRLEVSASTPEDSTNALIHNLSEHGLLVETEVSLVEGDTFEIDLPEAGLTAAVVVWTRSGLVGCAFQAPIPTAIVSAALLRSPPAVPVSTVIDPPSAGSVWDYQSSDDLDAHTSTQVIMIASLILALIAATIFTMALLSFPFSTD